MQPAIRPDNVWSHAALGTFAWGAPHGVNHVSHHGVPAAPGEGEKLTVTSHVEISGERVCLEIPSKPQFVSLCRLALTAICREHQFADDEIADLKLAITEACSNSIKHAYEDDSDDGTPRVFVTYEMRDDRLHVEVRDHGRGFDWEGPNDNELPEGGLGISIIQAVCDEFEVLRPSDGVGSSLRLTKLRRAS